MTANSARKYTVALAFAAFATFSMLGYAQTMGWPEKYTANAVNLDIGAQGPIDIMVEHWSTPAQRDKLMSVMLNQGPEKLLDVLKDMPHVGYFNTPGNLRWELRYAWKTPQPTAANAWCSRPTGPSASGKPLGNCARSTTRSPSSNSD